MLVSFCERWEEDGKFNVFGSCNQIFPLPPPHNPAITFGPAIYFINNASGASESPDPRVTSAQLAARQPAQRQMHCGAPAFSYHPPSFRFLVVVPPLPLFWLICFPDPHVELLSRHLGTPAACQDTPRSHVVTANVTKPAAHHCPAGRSTAGIGCKGHQAWPKGPSWVDHKAHTCPLHRWMSWTVFPKLLLSLKLILISHPWIRFLCVYLYIFLTGILFTYGKCQRQQQTTKHKSWQSKFKT